MEGQGIYPRELVLNALNSQMSCVKVYGGSVLTCSSIHALLTPICIQHTVEKREIFSHRKDIS